VYLSTIGSNFDERSPSISADRLPLHFHANRPDHPGWDIYVFTRATINDEWGPLSHLGPNVNLSGSSEFDPELSQDGLTLFYASDPVNSRGQGDLYVSTRKSTSDPWGPAINLGEAVNSGLQEGHPFLTSNGSELYFSRAPQGGTDPGSDNWRVKLVPFETVSLDGAGSVYSQDFLDLGTASETTGTRFPLGWTATPNDVVFQNATSIAFPGRRRSYAGYYNAGNPGDADRALATSRSIATRILASESGELDFRARIDGQPAKAVRLSFDLEAWGATGTATTSAANPGEAAFDVTLEADTGQGFQPVMTLGSVSTSATLQPPAEQPGIVNGNDPAYRKSFDSGILDLDDIPAGTKLRFRWRQPESTASEGWIFGLDNVRLVLAQPGDANADGLFTSADLVQVFQAGEYEDGIAGNSNWGDGDWDNDNDFTSGDLVVAFQSGKYEQAAAEPSSIPEPSGTMLVLIVGLVAIGGYRRKKRACF
jgi:hypothetical protein